MNKFIHTNECHTPAGAPADPRQYGRSRRIAKVSHAGQIQSKRRGLGILDSLDFICLFIVIVYCGYYV